MNKVLSLLVASVLLLRLSPSTGQNFPESDSSRNEGEILSTQVDITGVDSADEINVTAMTFAAFKAKYPDLGLPCSASVQGENKAEENDFIGGTVTLDLQSPNHVTVGFAITDDEKEEPEEIFLLILENRDGPITRTVMQNNMEVIEAVCHVGRIRESDRDAVSIQFKETSLNLMEEARNVNLAIVRNGASEVEREIRILTFQCGEAALEEGEDIVISPKVIQLQPTDVEVSELSLQIEILDDDIPERDECLTIQLPSTTNDITQTDIIIKDNDVVKVGWNQNGTQVEEGQSIDVCAVILEPQGEISRDVFIELDFQPLSNPASDGKFIVRRTSGNRQKLFLHTTIRTACVTVTANDDEKLESNPTFGIKLSATNAQVQITIEPDVVMVTITDNDGTPNRPEVTDVKLLNDDKDLFIMWDIEEDELRPVDSYTGTVNATENVNGKRRQTVYNPRGSTVFESEDKEETIQGIDAEKQYEIQVCARNRFGSNCSEPFAMVLPPEPIIPEETGGLATGAIIAIVIILVLLFLCCLLLLLFLLCFCRKERSKNYYPEKNEKKYAEEYDIYRQQHSRSPSIDSEINYEYEMEKVPI